MQGYAQRRVSHLVARHVWFDSYTCNDHSYALPAWHAGDPHLADSSRAICMLTYTIAWTKRTMRVNVLHRTVS